MKLNVCKYTKYQKHLSPMFFHYGVIIFRWFPFVFKKKKKKEIGVYCNLTCTLPKLYYYLFLPHQGTAAAWIIQRGSNQPYQTDRAHAVGHSQQLASTLRIRGRVQLAVSFGSLPGTEWDGMRWDEGKTKNRCHLPVCGDRRLLFVQ